MAEKNEEVQEYATLRVKAETSRKLKVLSGLKDKSQIDVIAELVDSAFMMAVSLAAKNIGKE